LKDYEICIGLEVHAELNTQSKMYCSCPNLFGGEPNTRVCPVCIGLPGALPTLNETAVDYAVKMGHALKCTINKVSRQDRKNYFYPDLPKAYQISQADIPLCEKGHLEIITEKCSKTIGITRIHIEEDAGKLLHDSSCNDSLVDYNRCGVPLIEIVTEPDLRSSEEAYLFLNTIKNTLKYIGISDCKMQEGSIRCDVNVSVREKGTDELGTRCEMKNVNSFSAAVRGIEYEAKRQIEVLEAGGKILQETRRWDDVKGMSFVMRTKEDAQDYRFFPEPDLGWIVLEEERINMLKDTLPELPNEKLLRYTKIHGLPFTDASLLVEGLEKSRFYDECIALERCTSKNICNWILGDISKYINDTGSSLYDTPLTADKLVKLVYEVEKGTISNSAAKKVLGVIFDEGGEPDEIIERLGLVQNSDTESLKKLVDEVIKANEKSVNDYRNGKTNAMGYIVGQCMKASKGSANPAIVRELVAEILNER